MPLELTRTLEDLRARVGRSLRHEGVADDKLRDHVRIVTGPQPYAHAHFAAERFFDDDSPAGVVRNIYGQRLLWATGNFFRSLHSALGQHAGERVDQVLFHIGFRWGQEGLKSFVPRLEQEYECTFEKLNMALMLESWWWPARATGWGSWRCDFRHAAHGLVVLELTDSASASALTPSAAPACALEAGLFASLFGHLARRELGCLEMECTAAGADCCRFVVATPARIEEAGRWRGSFAGLEEALRHLASMP